MLVRDRMSKTVVLVNSKTTILEAEKLMKEKGIRRLPVVDGGKIVGIVTYNDLLEAEPSKAISLSRFEITYLLSKMTVAEIMKKRVITIKPDTPIEEAALIMKKNNVGGMPVVQESQVIGVITESDIFGVLVETLGVEEGGTRITLELPMKAGVLYEVTSVIKNHQVNILSLATFHNPERANYRYIVIRVDSSNPDALLDDLTAKGFPIKHVWITPKEQG
ncbi:MAG TPA: CBS and ACT domain-containing protein [Atribacteraceae bacterium]|nr:CBS and ACT domain-containing protein [Atribacteraceae bacterium]